MLLQQGGAAASPLLPVEVANAGARWTVVNSGGTDAIGQVNDSPGLAIRDCCGPNQYFAGRPNPAFDTAFTLRVGDPAITDLNTLPILAVPGAGAVLSGTATVRAGPLTVAGLEAEVQYYFPAAQPLVRTLLSLRNPGAGAATVQVYWAHNSGVQSTERSFVGSSSGDMMFSAADRWVLTAANNQQSPLHLAVLAGPGALAPGQVFSQVFEDLDRAGIGAVFVITVPAGGTRRLLFFDQLGADAAAMASVGASFDATPPPGHTRLNGLTGVQLSEVVNWALPYTTVLLPTLHR